VGCNTPGQGLWSSFLGVESVLVPQQWIVEDITADSPVIVRIADDVVVETGLPCEIGMDGACLF